MSENDGILGYAHLNLLLPFPSKRRAATFKKANSYTPHIKAVKAELKVKN